MGIEQCDRGKHLIWGTRIDVMECSAGTMSLKNANFFLKCFKLRRLLFVHRKGDLVKDP